MPRCLSLVLSVPPVLYSNQRTSIKTTPIARSLHSPMQKLPESVVLSVLESDLQDPQTLTIQGKALGPLFSVSLLATFP